MALVTHSHGDAHRKRRRCKPSQTETNLVCGSDGSFTPREANATQTEPTTD